MKEALEEIANQADYCLKYCEVAQVPRNFLESIKKLAQDALKDQNS